MPDLMTAPQAPTVAAVNRAHNSFAAAYAWPATVSDGNGGQVANPETKAAHFARKVREYIRDVVKGQELEAARRSAEGTVTEIILT